MANDLKETSLTGGISFTTPVFSFGNTVPDINSGFSFDLPLADIQAFSDQALSFSANNSLNAQSFLANQIALSSQQVAGTASQAINLQSQSLDALKSVASSISDILKPSGGCFITTAICEEMGLDDDCYYLTTLRDFRDNVMLPDVKWREMVRDYYRIAPDIVAAINKREDKSYIYKMMREEYLIPCIALIEKKDNFRAIQLYREMVLFAQAVADDIVERQNG